MVPYVWKDSTRIKNSKRFCHILWYWKYNFLLYYIYQTIKVAVQFNIVFILSEDKVLVPKSVMYTLKNVVGNISVWTTFCLLEVDEIRKAYVFRTQVLASLILMRHLSYFLLNFQQTKKILIFTLWLSFCLMRKDC